MSTMSAEREAVSVASPTAIREEQKSTVVIKRTTPSKASPSPSPADTRPRKPHPAKAGDSTKKTSPHSKSSGDHGDSLVADSLAREFRGTSPRVLENIGTQSLLIGSNYEAVKRPNLSAKSRKVLRNTADLAAIVPGLRNLMEVQYLFVVFVLSCGFGLSL